MKFFRTVRKSFIGTLTLWICLFNLILMGLFITMNYYMIRSNVDRNTKLLMDNSLELSVRTCDEFITKTALSIEVFSGNNYVWNYMDSGICVEEAADEIKNLLSASKDFENMWVLRSDGLCIDKDGICDFSSTPLMEIPVYDEKTVRIGTYYSDACGAVLYKQFLSDDGTETSTVYARLNAASMGEFIQSTQTEEGAYTILLSDRGRVICGSSEVNKILGEDTKQSLRSILDGGQYRKASTIIKGKTRSYVIMTRLASGWIMGLVFDGTSVEEGFRKSLIQQIIVLLCILILELIASLNVIRYQSKDIPEISSSIAHISAGNYNFRINSTAENEIGLIANSVDALAQQLQDKNAIIEDYINLDATTGLYNRYKLYEYIKDLAEGRDESRQRFALLFVDIDNFKWVNETLGHRQGDDFLRIFGQRLKNVVTRAFRFSGDEFVIVTEIGKDAKQVHELIHALKEQFKEPVEILNNKLYAHFSVGVSIYPDDDKNLDMLLRDADIAMQRAKEKGKGRTEFFSTIFHQNVVNKSTIAQHLNKAVENNELFLVYQPIISVKNGALHGFEALVRWENAELGYVPPSSFVCIAEETGLIDKIGYWIFENGCKMLKKINRHNPDVVMSINVSAIQLKKADFMGKVRRAISVYGINPKNLQIEVTETSFVDLIDDEDNADKLEELASMGIAIALDDFGTGYSSFSYLKNMPIKTLKVDKSFVDEIGNKGKDYKITNSIIEMVHSLGIATVVEGVESIEQYNILSKFGCDYIQGFLMSKPLKESDAMEFVTEYEELHKPNEQMLVINSGILEQERKDHERQSKML